MLLICDSIKASTTINLPIIQLINKICYVCINAWMMLSYGYIVNQDKFITTYSGCQFSIDTVFYDYMVHGYKIIIIL